jgi:DNA polymerase-1
MANARAAFLAEIGDTNLNPNGTGGQLKAAFASKGIILENTKKETLKANGSTAAMLLLDYRNVRDKELKFLTGLSDATRPDGRIHAIFNSVGAKTGRFSSSKPNLQNIPRIAKGLFPVRSLFQAPQGKKLIIADFGQVELMAAAIIAGEDRMLEAFKSGADIHCQTASLLLGREVAKHDKHERSLAKAVNFGLLYGQYAKGLRAYAKSTFGVEMSEEDAVRFRKTFFSAYEGIAQWHDKAKYDANQNDSTEVRTVRINRRQFLPPMDRWWQRFTALVNTPVQGSCAEVMKLAMLKVGETMNDCAIVSCVHDELVCECDEANAESVKTQIVAIMKDRFKLIFGDYEIGVDATIADNWSEK